MTILTEPHRYRSYFAERKFYNFVKQAWEALPMDTERLQDYQAKPFIPQTPRGERLYRQYRAEKCTPYEAMTRTIYDIMGN